MSYAGTSKRESFWRDGMIIHVPRVSRPLLRAERMRISLPLGRLILYSMLKG